MPRSPQAPQLLPALLVTLGVLACVGCGSETEPGEPPPLAAAPAEPVEAEEPEAPGDSEAPEEDAEGIRIMATSTPVGATVSEGDRLLGTTPLSITVPERPGPGGRPPLFALTFAAPGHRSVTMYATPVEGRVSLSAVLAATPDEPDPSAGPAAGEAPRDSQEGAGVAAVAPGQSWRGSYVCSQGRTALTLRITEVRGEQVQAVFDFHHRGLGRRGSFTLSGRYQADQRLLVLRPRRWIRRPPRWRMLGMNGHLSEDGQTYRGRITDYGSCTSFLVRR